MKNEKSIEKLVELHRSNAIAQTERAESAANSFLFFENRIAFTLTEVAVLLGISIKSIERAIKRKEIEAKRLGRRWLIPRAAIEAWLNQKE